jgi:hypothetical protein
MLLQHLDGVVLQDAQIRQPRLLDALQQRADTGLVHLAGDEVDVRQCRSDLGRGVAHAEADLQHARRGAAEQRAPVGRAGLEGQHPFRRQLPQRTDLPAAHAPGALDEALDAARRLGRRQALFAHQPITSATSGVASGAASASVTAAW